MQDGLVYLRPVEVAFLRTDAVGPDAARALWDDLKAVLNAHGAANAVDRAYGLAKGSPLMGSTGAKATYIAAVTLVPGLPIAPQSKLHTMTLPGGAYQRERLRGDVTDIGESFEVLCDQFQRHHDIKLDQDRPLVEIRLLSDSLDQDPRKIELCVPVKPRVGRADAALLH
ncbi:MAG: GyrI-like domain-containing protein [Pseudomonadota bacterium]